MTRNSLLVGAILIAVASLNGPLVANGNDYAFEPLGTEVKEGEVTLAVRLVHTPTGNVVPDATILQTRIDMEPDGMAAMDAPIAPAPNPVAGIYTFKTNLIMQGRWLLTISAKVRGEPETIVGKIIFRASP